MTKKEVGRQPPKGRWFLMVLFPPYGFYRFIKNPRIKWFVKVPLFLIVAIIAILAIDQTVNPHRVEVVQAEQAITEYIEKNPDMRMGALRIADRKGAFPWDNETQILYRTLTTNGLYDVLIKSEGDSAFKVDAVFQTYPEFAWAKPEYKNKFPTAPMAMLYFYEQQEELGEFKGASEDQEENTVETTKGTFYYTFEKNRVITVKDKDGKSVLQQKNEYYMPEDAVKYFEKNENELGKLVDVFDYRMNTAKEMFFVNTTEGVYRVDDHRDGNIHLLKQEISN